MEVGLKVCISRSDNDMLYASIGEALSVLQSQDKAFNLIPEIEESAIGKNGRVEFALLTRHTDIND